MKTPAIWLLGFCGLLLQSPAKALQPASCGDPGNQVGCIQAPAPTREITPPPSLGGTDDRRDVNRPNRNPINHAGAPRCAQGYVWREARSGDTVCVVPATRAATLQENAQAATTRVPGGGWAGPDTCLNGYVWREALVGDTVCVRPDSRRRAARDNAAAAQHVAR